MIQKKLLIAIKAAVKAGDAILEVYNQVDVAVDMKEDNTPITAADRAAHQVIDAMLKESGIPLFSEEGEQVSYSERSHWEQFWLVDPLDGTKEFIKRNGEFTVNIALIENDLPVAGVVYVPVTGVLYFAALGFGAWKVVSPMDMSSLEKLIDESEQLPLQQERNSYVLVGSRSFQTVETDNYFEECKGRHENVEITSVGSSLKLCMVAEGTADEYPRLGTINEWDTAAGDAVVRASGGTVTVWESGEPMLYNKESMKNPWFCARRAEL